MALLVALGAVLLVFGGTMAFAPETVDDVTHLTQRRDRPRERAHRLRGLRIAGAFTLATGLLVVALAAVRL